MAPLADIFVRIRVDKGSADRQLDETARKVEGLDGQNININVRVEGDQQASARMAALEAQARSLKRELDQASRIKFATRIDTQGLQALGASIGKLTVVAPAAIGALGLPFSTPGSVSHVQ